MAKSPLNEEDFRRFEKDRHELNSAYDNGYTNETSHRNGKKDSVASDDFVTGNDLQDRIDKYGFIHSSKLPPQLTVNELRRNNIEKSREIKWKTMVTDWSKHCAPNRQYFSEKLITRVFKGIPNSMRNAAWYKLLDIESQIKAQQGVYEKMKYLARKYSLELRQIDLDINRTFRNNYAYKKRYCPRQKQLYNVLAAYSVYNTEVGYCQGMSTLTALLLMYLSDEEITFWALSELMSNPKYLMHGLFKSGFPKLIRFSDKHELILKTFLPKIHKKFIKCNITPLIYTTKWFLQCYLDALPFSLVLRVWDVYLLKGEIVILAMSYCILKMHKRTLLQKDFDMDKINDFLNHKLPENFLYDDDFVMEKLAKCIDKLANFKLESGVSLLETAPANELPNVPFGDFKPVDYELMYTRNNSLKRDENNNRDEQLKQIARSRLETEKKNRDERRRKRREERERQQQALSPSSQKQLDDRLMKINNNRDSDDSDNDSDLAAASDDSDDDDDLNPSKLSEYDDDKMDKESLLSNLTRQSSLQKSLNDVQSQSSMEVFNNNRQAQTNSSSLNKNSKSSFSNSSFLNQTSDYENMNSKPPLVGDRTMTQTYNSNSLQYQGSSRPAKQASVVSPHNVPKTTSTTGLSSLSVKSSFPSSQSYINPTAAIISNPPPAQTTPDLAQVWPTQLYKQTTNNQNVASIRTNPDYYLNPNTNTASSRFVITKMSEYVRSPHGIYTRVNVHPTASYRPTPSSSSSIPQSTSTVVINGASAVRSQNGDSGNGNKRAASLRSIQKHHHYTGEVAGSGVSAGAPMTGHVHSMFTPTKLQLENHSLRIANIQNQQLKSKPDSTKTTSSSSMTVISQAPNHRNSSLKSSSHHHYHHHHNNHNNHNHGHYNHNHHHQHQHQHQQQQPLNQHFNGLEIAPNYQGTSTTGNNKSLNTNKFTNYDSQDLIEQYDYI